MSNRFDGRPPLELLRAIYRQLPVLVVVLQRDGKVLYCNPATTRTTGFAENELVGQNLWAMLFPGRLFAQVPKFISATHPAQILAKDVAMVLRTREGKERVVAWSRMVADGPGEALKSDSAEAEWIVCIGTDLTDRLDAADVPPDARAAVEDADATEAFGPDVGNAGTVDGEVITPIAISPPTLPGENLPASGAAVQQIHEFLMGIDERIEALESAFTQGELARLAGIATSLRNGAHACGLLEFSTRAEKLHAAASRGALEQVSCLVHQIVSMVRPESGG